MTLPARGFVCNLSLMQCRIKTISLRTTIVVVKLSKFLANLIARSFWLEWSSAFQDSNDQTDFLTYLIKMPELIKMLVNGQSQRFGFINFLDLFP